MADQKVSITAGAGTNIDTSEVTTSSGTVERQRIVITDDSTAAALAKVQNAQPGSTDYALTVREAQKGQTTMANSRPVVLASDQAPINTSTPDTVVTFSFTAAQATMQTATTAASSAQVLMAGRSAVSFNVTGTWVGTIVCEASIDGSAGNWIDIDFYDEANEKWVLGSTGVTTNGTWFTEQIGGFNVVRLRMSAWTSGTATGTLLGSAASMSGTPEWTAGNGSVIPPTVGMVGGSDGTNLRPLKVSATGVVSVDGSAVTQPVSGTVTVNALPTGGNIIGLVEISDGTNTSTVKAASTAAVATDKALVISISPNTNTVQLLSGTQVKLTDGGGTNVGTIKAASTAAALTDTALVVAISPNSQASAVNSTVLETGHIVKASAGVLHGFSGYNSRISSQFIQVHNTTTVPANTAVPIIVLFVPGQSNFSFDAGRFGFPFATGISICNSSTAPTLTIGSADTWFNVLFT